MFLVFGIKTENILLPEDVKRPLNVVVTEDPIVGNVDGKFSNLNNPKLLPKKNIFNYMSPCSCGKNTN